MNAKEYLESKGVFSLDTKKRYNEVIKWMEGYAKAVNKKDNKPIKTKLEKALFKHIERLNERISKDKEDLEAIMDNQPFSN